MSCSVYYSTVNYRWQGYEVPGECDYVGCREIIYRDIEDACLSKRCNCQAFYCKTHVNFTHDEYSVSKSEDSIEWLLFILNDENWEAFREENQELMKEYEDIIDNNS